MCFKPLTAFCLKAKSQSSVLLLPHLSKEQGLSLHLQSLELASWFGSERPVKLELARLTRFSQKPCPNLAFVVSNMPISAHKLFLPPPPPSLTRVASWPACRIRDQGLAGDGRNGSGARSPLVFEYRYRYQHGRSYREKVPGAMVLGSSKSPCKEELRLKLRSRLELFLATRI